MTYKSYIPSGDRNMMSASLNIASKMITKGHIRKNRNMKTVLSFKLVSAPFICKMQYKILFMYA